jgi:hypothetical protein
MLIGLCLLSELRYVVWLIVELDSPSLVLFFFLLSNLQRETSLTQIPSAYFAQGVLLHREKHSAAAEASFLEARTLWLKGDQTQQHPFHAGCLYKLGLVCLEQGKREESMYVSLAP